MWRKKTLYLLLLSLLFDIELPALQFHVRITDNDVDILPSGVNITAELNKC